MTTIYAEFASLPTEIVAFGVGGPDFVGQRASGGTPSAAPTIASLASRRLVFVAQSLEQFARTFPEALVWKAPYLVFALLGVDVQVGDVYTDGTLGYLISGEPVSHYGFVLGPAALLPHPPHSLALRATAGFQAGLRIAAW